MVPRNTSRSAKHRLWRPHKLLKLAVPRKWTGKKRPDDGEHSIRVLLAAWRRTKMEVVGERQGPRPGAVSPRRERMSMMPLLGKSKESGKI
jgi:hypothetical protein